MKILSNLTATTTEGDWTEPLGVRAAIHDEPVKGFIRQMQVGPSGICILGAGASVAIPIAELFRAAELAEPRLKPTTKPSK
jgi:hypothetical protein